MARMKGDYESPAEDRGESGEEPGESRGRKMKGKSKSRSSPTFAKGGGGHMVGQQHTGTQTPGQTATKASGGGGKFAQGGSGHMVGKQEASPAKPA